MPLAPLLNATNYAALLNMFISNCIDLFYPSSNLSRDFLDFNASCSPRILLAFPLMKPPSLPIFWYVRRIHHRVPTYYQMIHSSSWKFCVISITIAQRHTFLSLSLRDVMWMYVCVRMCERWIYVCRPTVLMHFANRNEVSWQQPVNCGEKKTHWKKDTHTATGYRESEQRTMCCAKFLLIQLNIEAYEQHRLASHISQHQYASSMPFTNLDYISNFVERKVFEKKH